MHRLTGVARMWASTISVISARIELGWRTPARVVDLAAEGLEFRREPLFNGRVVLYLTEIMHVREVYPLVRGQERAGECGRTWLVARPILVLPVVLCNDRHGQLDLFGCKLWSVLGVV